VKHRLEKLAGICRRDGLRAGLRFLLADVYFRGLAMVAFPGRRIDAVLPAGSGRNPYSEFMAEMNARENARVLEIGARAVSGITVRDSFGRGVNYTGMDIHKGPNVDVAGDAHELAKLFPTESFDGVFSLSVYEHLLMPWVVAVETNKILKMGGLTLVSTHPTWPPHELPWDFWRFQENAFWALFNASTGFEIVTTSVSTPARIFPASRAGYLIGGTKTICPMGVSVLARKVGPVDPRLSWPLTAAEITRSSYPLRSASAPSPS
jgi:hypothetical protein